MDFSKEFQDSSDSEDEKKNNLKLKQQSPKKKGDQQSWGIKYDQNEISNDKSNYTFNEKRDDSQENQKEKQFNTEYLEGNEGNGSFDNVNMPSQFRRGEFPTKHSESFATIKCDILLDRQSIMQRFQEEQQKQFVPYIDEEILQHLDGLQIEILISEAENIVEKGIIDSSYTLYRINLLESKKQQKTKIINCQRRYKEFRALRQSLQKAWPGCFIPPLPGKSQNKLDLNIISQRKVYLTRFLQEIVKRFHLYSSAEFQYFLQTKDTKVYEKLKGYASNEIEGEKLLKLQSKYLRYFQKYDSPINEEQEIQIWNFRKFLEESSDRIDQFYLTQLKELAIFYDKYLKQVQSLIKDYLPIKDEDFETIDQMSRQQIVQIQEYNNLLNKSAYKQIQNNIYRKMYDVIKLEGKDMISMVEAINQYYEYKESLKKNELFLENLKEKLEKVQQGQKPFLNYFNSKSMEQEQQEMEQKIQDQEQKNNQLKKIQEIIFNYILNYEIIRFKLDKSRVFKQLLGDSSVIEKNFNQDLLNFWNQMAILAETDQQVILQRYFESTQKIFNKQNSQESIDDQAVEVSSFQEKIYNNKQENQSQNIQNQNLQQQDKIVQDFQEIII